MKHKTLTIPLLLLSIFFFFVPATTPTAQAQDISITCTFTFTEEEDDSCWYGNMGIKCDGLECSITVSACDDGDGGIIQAATVACNQS